MVSAFSSAVLPTSDLSGQAVCLSCALFLFFFLLGIALKFDSAGCNVMYS